MSISKGGQRQTQSGQSGVDSTTMAYLQQIMDAAKGAGAAGPSPLVNGATDYNSAAMKAGTTGLNALGGDPNAINSLMNPYISNVIGGLRGQADVTNANTMNQVNDAAAKANAFGGSRAAVTQGTMLSQNARDLNSQIGGLLNSGYTDAMNRAGAAAGLGFNGAAGNAQLGLGGVGSPQQWMLQQLRNGFVMPTGSTYSGAGSSVYGGMQFDPMKMFQAAGAGAG